MEKNQKAIWIFLLISNLFFPSLYGEESKIELVGPRGYVPLNEFLEVFPDLKFKNKAHIRIGVLSGNGKSIRFRSGSSFYTIDQKIQKTKSFPVHYKGDYLLPPEFVEAIFLYLIGYDVMYEWSERELKLQVPNRVNQPGFLPVRAIIIDPGHGGKDPGTSDRKGNTEKEIALTIALRLEAQLKKKYPNMIVIMTRKEDTFIPLEERSSIANGIIQKTKDSIFLSIHCNSAISPEPYGFEIYFLSQTPSLEQDREVAIRENKILSGNYPPPIPSIQAGMYSSLIQRRSQNLANAIEKELEGGVGKFIPSRGVKKANFSVLRGTLMPAILIEVGYLSHPKEAIFLNSPKMQSRIIKSIIRGIEKYSNGKD